MSWFDGNLSNIPECSYLFKYIEWCLKKMSCFSQNSDRRLNYIFAEHFILHGSFTGADSVNLLLIEVIVEVIISVISFRTETITAATKFPTS